MTQLPIKQGIDGLPTNTIPTDPTAFIDWFKNSFLPRWAANADVRNATPGVGVQISGNPNTPGFVGFEEISGNSVLGNPTGAQGDVQAIVAGADGEFLQRSGGVLAFGPIVSDESITGAGTAAEPLQLVGDAASPGNSLYYGTDASGAKGYHILDASSLNNITPDSHPTIPAGVGLGPNDEFEGATLDLAGTRYVGATPWTWYNQLSTAVTLSEGSIVVASSGVSSTFSAFGQPAPPAPWTYVAKIAANQFLAANLAYGFVIRDIANDKQVMIGFLINTGAVFAWFPASNNVLSAANTFATWANGSDIINFCAEPAWLQLTFDGTTFAFSMSRSGVPGTFAAPQFTVTLGAAGLGTADIICLGVAGGGIGTGSIPANMSADWFRRTA